MQENIQKKDWFQRWLEKPVDYDKDYDYEKENKKIFLLEIASILVIAPILIFIFKKVWSIFS